MSAVSKPTQISCIMLIGSEQQVYTSTMLHMVTSMFPKAGSPSQIRAHSSSESDLS